MKPEEIPEFFWLMIETKTIDIADVDCPQSLIASPMISIMTPKMRATFIMHWDTIKDDIENIKKDKGQLFLMNQINMSSLDTNLSITVDDILRHIKTARKISRGDLEMVLTHLDYSDYFRVVDDLMEFFHANSKGVRLYNTLNKEENKVCSMRGLLQRRLRKEQSGG